MKPKPARISRQAGKTFQAGTRFSLNNRGEMCTFGLRKPPPALRVISARNLDLNSKKRIRARVSTGR
jgi:hypothetical protein